MPLDRDPLDAELTRARGGDAASAERLLLSVRGKVFNLALRFLGDPEDANDASQEICVKIWKGLPGFRGESSFSTWALAIAANHLRTAKKSRLEGMGISFEAYEAEAGSVPLGAALPGGGAPDGPERALLTEELKHSCSLGMLLCLDRADRLAYILYAFFGVSSEEGGSICGVSAAAYRQRASRTRKKMAAFMTEVCGLAGSGAPCRCSDRVPYALARGRIGVERLYYSTNAVVANRARALTASMERLDAASAVFRAGPDFRQPSAPGEVRGIIASVASPFVDA